MKTADEIKRGLRYLSIRDIVHKMDMWKEGIAYDYAEDAAADALAYIQQLETENHQLLTKAQQLESAISQVSKALCGKENATLKELLQAADQLKARAPRWISVEERLPDWPCVVYDGINPPYTPRCSIVQVTKSSGKVEWIADLPVSVVLDGKMVEVHHLPFTQWMPLPELPKEDAP